MVNGSKCEIVIDRFRPKLPDPMLRTDPVISCVISVSAARENQTGFAEPDLRQQTKQSACTSLLITQIADRPMSKYLTFTLKVQMT